MGIYGDIGAQAYFSIIVLKVGAYAYGRIIDARLVASVAIWFDSKF
jgi:hypothetical protein